MMKQKEERTNNLNMISKQRIDALFLCILIVNIQTSRETIAEHDYYRYLQQFGYTSKVEGRRLFSVLAKSAYTDGILKFQRLYKLPVSLFDLFK